jgi:hypothetical protein
VWSGMYKVNGLLRESSAWSYLKPLDRRREANQVGMGIHWYVELGQLVETCSAKRGS